MLLVHGFPEFWWAWRDHIEPLTEAGFRVAAVDLRGYGASDKPPRGYDLETASDDLSGVIRSLGEEHAVVIGHDLGGVLGWTLAVRHPERVWALGTLAAPHPNLLWSRRRLTPTRLARTRTHLRTNAGELAREPWIVHRLLGQSAGAGGWPPAEVAARYAEAMTIPFAAQGATSYNEALLRGPFTPSGIRLRRRLSTPINQPLLALGGADDPIVPTEVLTASVQFAPRRAVTIIVDDAGHYLHEEAPATVGAHLVGWLDSLT